MLFRYDDMCNENRFRWDQNTWEDLELLRMPKRKRLNAEDAATRDAIVQPKANDVLFGRGDSINR